MFKNYPVMFKQFPKYRLSCVLVGIFFTAACFLKSIPLEIFIIIALSHASTQFCLYLDTETSLQKYAVYGIKALVISSFIVMFLICFVGRSKIIKLIWGI